MRQIVLTLLLLTVAHMWGTAETTVDTVAFKPNRVLSTAYSVEVGGERAFNTYLSPLRQTGWTVGIGGEWSRPMGSSACWGQDIGVRARIGLLENPARNATMNDLQLSLSWRALRSFSPLPDLTLGLGAGALLDAGMLYLPRNSNNPVAARAYLGVTLEGNAAWSFRLWDKRFRLLESVSLPSLGIFFSPHYGQSYYEIYLGDTSGLAHCGWWGNRFAINNLFALEVPTDRVRLRLGYRLEVLNSIASDIDSRITTHSFVLGISTDWLNVTRRHE
ncbi:MAG: DUF3316 domain-containing protein [Prevotella sp.]|nr:DUF3316 domain-containing protein [Prevotella sp.]MCM1074819.1 DUF3316 domain-containing protein [Ruminococcus sp.]